MSNNTDEEIQYLTLEDLNYFWMPNGAPCFIANNYDIIDDYCEAVEGLGFQIYYIITDKETTKTIQAKNDKGVMVPTQVYEYAPAIFKVVNNLTGRAVMESKEAFGNTFCPVKEVAEYTMPPIPKIIIDKLDEFFRLVHAQHGTESIVILTYDQNKEGSDGWGVLVPEQQNNSVHCKYDADSIAEMKPDHVMIVGSVHSHPEMPAYASGTDHDDQADFDGIHITYGWQKTLNGGATQYHIELQIGGSNYKLDPEDVFEYSLPPLKDPDPEVLAWSSKVKKAQPLYTGGSVSQVAQTQNQSYQTTWAQQTTNSLPTQVGTDTATTVFKSFDRNTFLNQLGTIEQDAIVAIEIDDSTNPDLTCFVCNFNVQDLDINSGFCMTCDTPLITPNMGHFDILQYMAYYCRERSLDQTVPFYVYCVDEHNTSNNFLINIKPSGSLPDDIASANVDDEIPFDPTIDPEYTVCCNLPISMKLDCTCPVTVLEEDIADFDIAHSRVDIYDSTEDCMSCDHYYQTSCPAFREALVNFTTYNTTVKQPISKCENYIHYKEATDPVYESSRYYE